MTLTHVFFNIIFDKKTQNPISLSLISSCNKSLYFEFNDHNSTLENEIYNNLDFNNYDQLISKINKNHTKGKESLPFIICYIDKWLEQFSNIIFVGDSLNLNSFDINKIFYCDNYIELSDLFIKNKLEKNHSRVKYSKTDTTRNFNHSLYDCKVLQDCYNQLIA